MKQPFIIGITGSYGKTSCAYLLHKYFKYLDYSSGLLSSNKLELPENNLSVWNNHITTPEQMQYYIFQAKGCDFLIIEINEQSLANNIYDKVLFDCKVLVNFENNFNPHRRETNYLKLKKYFMQDANCTTIVNKNSDNYEEFITTSTILFSTKENDKCLIYPKNKKIKFKHSNFQFIVDEDLYEINGIWSLSEYKNILTTLSILYALDIVDVDSFLNDFLESCRNVEGCNERHVYNKRNIIIDRGNEKALHNLINDLEDAQDYKIKGLLSAVGISNELYDEITSQNDFISLNIYNEKNAEMRRNCFIFGGNLYKAYYKTDYWRDDDVTFQGAMDEIGYNPLLNYTNIEINIPEGLIEEMYRITTLLGRNEMEKSYGYVKNFWWREISAIKHCMIIHYEWFEELFNQFEALNNKELTEACAYLKKVAEYQIAWNKRLADEVNSLPIDKFYLTVNTSNNEDDDQLLLEGYKTFFTKDVEIFTSREEALSKMALESKENDILFIGGRGDSSMYNDRNSQKYKSDNEIMKQFLEEQ